MEQQSLGSRSGAFSPAAGSMSLGQSIQHLHDSFAFSGQLFLAMELLTGPSLAKLLHAS